MKLSLLLAVSASFGVVCPISQAFQPDKSVEAQTWLQDMVTRSKKRFADSSFKAKYQVASLARVDPAEVAALRERLKPFPEHPDRAKLAELERQLKDGPPLRVHSIWFRLGDFRLNEESSKGTGASFFDVCNVGESAWKTTEKELVLLGRSDARPAGHQVEIQRNAALTELSSFFGAGIGMFGEWTERTTFKLEPDGKWLAMNPITDAQGASQGKISLRGTWDPERKAGRSESAEMLITGQGAVAWKEVVEQWSHFDDFPGELARSVKIEMNGQQRRLTLVEISKLDEAEFRDVTRTPTLNGSDAVRGKYGFTQLADLTGRGPSYAIRDSSTGILTNLTYDQSREGQSRSLSRILGWISAAMILACLVTIRLKMRPGA